jgi:hypothetical protein
MKNNHSPNLTVILDWIVQMARCQFGRKPASILHNVNYVTPVFSAVWSHDGGTDI